MKKLIISFLFVALLSSCASMVPAGNWDYAVTGTPQGDYAGVLTVTKLKEGYEAKMTGETGEIKFDKFSYDKKTKKTTGRFYFSGVDIDFAAFVETDKMKGSMATGGTEFPFAATRKK